MIWNSASDFFAMGGYALYVWGSFGVCAIALTAETWLLRLRRDTILRTLRRQSQADQLEEELK